MKKLLLLDADVIIDLHILELFDKIAKAYAVFVTHSVFDEAKSYPKGNRKFPIEIEKKVTIIDDIDLSCIHKVLLEAKEARLTIDDGEAMSIAVILDADEEIYFCTCDKAAIKLISYMGVEHKAMSLENALRSASHHKNLYPRHFESTFRNCVREGKALRMQFKKFR